ncbi:hypothetical protein SMY28_001848 [Cronobacter dublinensis]|nr:hypothetical protein [Cronobacter dublinensis]
MVSTFPDFQTSRLPDFQTSRRPHVPNNKSTVIGRSGVTFGRGLDLGQQTTTYLEFLSQEMEKHSQPLSASLKILLPRGVETRY